MGRVTLNWGLSHCDDGDILYTTDNIGPIWHSNDKIFVYSFTHSHMYICLNSIITLNHNKLLYNSHTSRYSVTIFTLVSNVFALSVYGPFTRPFERQALLQINHTSSNRICDYKCVRISLRLTDAMLHAWYRVQSIISYWNDCGFLHICILLFVPCLLSSPDKIWCLLHNAYIPFHLLPLSVVMSS